MALRPTHLLFAFVPAAVASTLLILQGYLTEALGVSVPAVLQAQIVTGAGFALALALAAGIGRVVARDVDVAGTVLPLFVLFAAPVLVVDAALLAAVTAFPVDWLQPTRPAYQIALRLFEVAVPVGVAGVAGAAVGALRAR